MTQELISKSSEASKGGLQAVLEVSGTFESAKLVAGKFKRDNETEPRDQAEVTVASAEILKLAEGEDMPKLKDGKYTFWITYAQRGKKPSGRSPFVKGFQKSAEKIWEKRGEKDKGWRDLLGEHVIFKVVPVELFARDTKEGETATEPSYIDEEGQYHVVVRTWTFATEGSSAENITDYLVENIVSKTKPVALRFLATDDRAKQHPSYKDALQADNLGSVLPVTIGEDGKFKKVEA